MICALNVYFIDFKKLTKSLLEITQLDLKHCCCPLSRRPAWHALQFPDPRGLVLCVVPEHPGKQLL